VGRSLCIAAVRRGADRAPWADLHGSPWTRCFVRRISPLRNRAGRTRGPAGPRVPRGRPPTICADGGWCGVAYLAGYWFESSEPPDAVHSLRTGSKMRAKGYKRRLATEIGFVFHRSVGSFETGYNLGYGQAVEIGLVPSTEFAPSSGRSSGFSGDSSKLGLFRRSVEGSAQPLPFKALPLPTVAARLEFRRVCKHLRISQPSKLGSFHLQSSFQFRRSSGSKLKVSAAGNCYEPTKRRIVA
jgi:hypothetical protein